jgi:hypothetical protein
MPEMIFITTPRESAGRSFPFCCAYHINWQTRRKEAWSNHGAPWAATSQIRPRVAGGKPLLVRKFTASCPITRPSRSRSAIVNHRL